MCKINGKKLKELRMARGLSRKQLASQIGISEYAICNYETNRNGIDEKNLDKVCIALKIKKDDIEIHDIGYSFLNNIGKVQDQYRRKNKISITPVELEKILQEKREFTEDKEKAKVKSAIKNLFKIGGKKYILIEPLMIHIPEWQRDTYMPKVEEIKVNFNQDKFDPIKCYVVNGILYVADGAHRLIALIKRNELLPEDEQEEVLVEILSCGEHESILTFLGQTIGRKAMSTSDMYRAGVKANIQEYIEFKDVFESNNIQITSELTKLDNPIGKVTPNTALLRLTSRKRELVEDIINLVVNLNWIGSGQNVFTMRNFNVLKKLYAKYGEEIKDKLMTYCCGATYYESKVAPIKSNAELYDMLVADISK